MSQTNPLMSVQEALVRLLAEFHPLSTEDIPLEQATGRVLSGEIRAPQDYPRFANSSMDGFAVIAADVQNVSKDHPIVLRIIEDIPAGYVPQKRLNHGQCARIMTGAALPDSANAVVPLEITNLYGDHFSNQLVPETVEIYQPVSRGDFIRQRGEDFLAGSLVMSPRALRPQEIGFLAMLGIPKVGVYRRPKIALLSTGDELLAVGSPLLPGKIYDTNSYTLVGLASGAGAEIQRLGIIQDSEDAVYEAMEQAASLGVDLILSSAGVSVGAFDYVRSIVERYGELQFWRVNMRPGKPLAFGKYRDIPFIGLPGNPVSAFVGFEVFVRPAIRKMSGVNALVRPVLKARLIDNIESDGRESFLRGIVMKKNGEYLAKLTGHQGSGNLFSLVQANAMLIIPSGVKSLPSGAQVDVWPLENKFGGIFGEESNA